MSTKFLKRPVGIGDRLAMRVALANTKNPFRKEPCCDFCGSVLPIYLYASSVSSLGALQTVWRWAACDECSILLDHEELELMEDRMVRFLEMMLTISTNIFKVTAQLALEEFRRFAVRVEDDDNDANSRTTH